MSTVRANVDLDRNAGRFQAPPIPTTLPSEFRHYLEQFTKAVVSAFGGVQQNNQRLKVWYDQSNSNTAGVADLTVITGVTLNTNSATLTFATQSVTVLATGATSSIVITGTNCGGS